MLLDLLFHHHPSHDDVGVSEASPSTAPTKNKLVEKLRLEKKVRERDKLNEYNLRLKQDDQLATDFIVALVTKGFFNVC